MSHAGASHDKRRRSGRSAPLPGPLRRLWRDRTRLVAVVLLGVVALAASGVQSAAALALQDTLNANWRGAYDVLVTAKGSQVGKDGLLAPNSLATGKTMTLADVAKIRAVGGVDVAAPIGEVVLPQLGQSTLNMNLPESSVDAKTEPQAFRVTVTYTTNDGLGERIVMDQKTDVVIDDTPQPPLPKALPCTSDGGFEVDLTKYPLLCQQQQITTPLDRGNVFSAIEGSNGWGGGGSASNGAFPLEFSPVPQGSTRITLVDPVAERKLLGKAGAFLAPLEQLKPSSTTSAASMAAWARSSKTPYARDFLAQQNAVAASQQAAQRSETAMQKEYWKEAKAYTKEHHLKTPDQTGSPAIYVPLLAASGGEAELTATVDVQSLGAASVASEIGQFPYTVSKAPGTELGTTTLDASGLLNPFSVAQVLAAWPGTSSQKPGADPLYVTRGINSPGTAGASPYSVRKNADGSVSGRLAAPGYLLPIPPEAAATPDPFALSQDGTVAGIESVYSPVTLVPGKPAADNSMAVPVGSFSTKQLGTLQSALSYVPLGAYQSIGSTVTTGGTTKQLKPSVTGLGLVSPATVAIASINSASAWHQKAPVNAVRVRVAGISTYSPAAEKKVVDVAAAIQKLGFTATIVAGSSPTDVSVTVAGYAFGTMNANKPQRVGTLGNLTQRWSELGAAARADIAISTASLSILGIALGSTALLLGAVQFVSVPRRRARAAVLREIGWTRGRIRRWMSAEEVPAILVVIAAGLGAIALSGATRVSVTIAGIGVAVVFVTSVVAVAVGSVARSGPGRIAKSNVGRRRLLLRGRTLLGFGLRQVRIHLLTTVTLVAATLIVAVSAAGLVDVFLSGRRAAGSSLLAQFTTDQAAIPQLVLGATGLAAGVILAVLTRRIDLARRTPQWEAMRAMGWTSEEITASQRAESLAIAIPAVILAAAASWGGAMAIHAASPILFCAIGAGAALVVSATVLFVRRKVSRS